MDRQTAKDTIARYRYEARRARERAREIRRAMRAIRSHPIGLNTDPVRLLKMKCELNALTLLAKKRDRSATDLKVFL